MASGELYRIAVEGSCVNGSGNVVNVFHYTQTTPSPTGANGAADLASTWQVQLMDLYVACLSTSYQLESYHVRNIDNPTEGADVIKLVPEPGDVVGDMMPPQTSCLISWRTGLIGRSYRGRTYLPPTGESAVGSAGALTAGQLAAIGAFAEAALVLESTVTFAGFQLVIYSPTVPARTPVSSYSVRGGIAIQRKRA